MRFITAAWISFVFLASAIPSYAANKTTETWEAKWPGGSCTLVMSYDTADLAGSVKVIKPCGKILRKVKSFVYTDDSREHMILFAKKKARGAMVGSFDRSGKNRLEGLIGDGETATMFLGSSSSVTINSGVSAGSSQSNSQSCRYYSGSQQCARDADLKNPTFKTVKMTSMVNQDIFPFSGGKGFAKDERAGRGMCMVVKKCETAFNSSEDWCEVVLSDGFFTGWVKRMDADFVYLRKGC
jgi:hypothetical protein